MKVNIYYGGRGLIDDPTLFVLEKMEKVLDELRVSVERYNLYEEKSNITPFDNRYLGNGGIRANNKRQHAHCRKPDNR